MDNNMRDLCEPGGKTCWVFLNQEIHGFDIASSYSENLDFPFKFRRVDGIFFLIL